MRKIALQRFASDPAALYNYTYDALGRATQILASVTGMSDSVLLGQQFDASGNRTQLNVDISSAVDSTTSYLYDARNRMIEILQNQVGATAASAALADKRIQLGYDPAGRINRIDRFDGSGATNPVISSIFQRDGLGRLIGLDHYDTLAWQADLATSTTPAVGGSILANYQFAFDLASQMTSMLSGLDGLSQYNYDLTAQLVGIETTDSTLPDQAFAFDDNGNRTDPETIVGVNNRLLQNVDFNYVYDAEDRLVERHSRTDDTSTLYTWDHRGRLVSVAHYDVDPVSGLDVLLGHVTYQYDVFDRPVSSFSAEGESNANPRQTHRIYDGQHLLLRFVDGELANRYLHGPLVDQLLVDERVGASESLSRWVLADHQGTVRDLAVRDASTDEIIISNHRVFDAFGNLLSETAGGETTIFGYAGREWEEVADLQFNRARWYDPTIGRWISQDPIGFAAGDANLYRYVGNGVTTKVDPSGLYELDVHFYATYYIALAVGLGEHETELMHRGLDGDYAASQAMVAAWACQFVDDYGPTGPFGSVKTREIFHFRGAVPFNGVKQGNKSSAQISHDAIASGSIVSFGIGLHPFEDSFSHSGYGPKIGHLFAGHSPDYPYNDVDKALRMAKRVHALMTRWQKEVNGEKCVKSFASIEATLKRLFELPGDTYTRSMRWKWIIERDFNVSHSSYSDFGGEHPWTEFFGAAVDEITK